MFVLAAAFSVLLQTTSDPALVELTRHSSIIFNGTVEKQHASTIDVPEEENTAIVRVDDVFLQPQELIRLKGQRVTARFRKGTAPPGGQGLFFTTLYSAGRSVGVDVNGFVNDMSGERGRDVVAQAREAVAYQDMARRVAKADLVVAGTVRAIHRLDAPRISEHDPELAAADVAVETVLKGQLPKSQRVVTIWFASSNDALFYHWPKLHEGESGIFIAHSQDPEMAVLRERASRVPEGVYVIDRADVQPLSSLQRVRTALQEGATR